MHCRTDWYNKKKQQLFKCSFEKDADFRVFTKEAGHNQVFQKLIQDRDNHGNTVLHYAAKAGNLKACKILKTGGADMKAQNKNKMTPLQFAARFGDGKPRDVFKCIEMMMKEERKKNMTGILHHAIQNGNWGTETHVAKELIKSGRCKISEKDQYGNTSLHLAAMSDRDNDHKILDLFLDDENICTKDDLIECLKERNNKGRTPYHIACYVGNHESVEQLIQKGTELDVDVSDILNSRDNSERLPIYIAIDSNNVKLLEVLVSKDIDLAEVTANDLDRAKLG